MTLRALILGLILSSSGFGGTGGVSRLALPTDSPIVSEKGAILRTIVLPGWGLKSLGRTDLARQSLIREGLFWLTFAALASTSDYYNADFRAYAVEHADAEFDPRPDIYYYRMANYESMEFYNQEMLRQRAVGDVYPTGSGWEWDWDSEATQEQFDEIRQRSLFTAKGARFAAGALVAHRALSAIQILFLTRSVEPVQAMFVPFNAGMILRLSFNF